MSVALSMSVPDLVSDAYPTGCSEHQVCSDELGGLCALGRSPVPCGRRFVSLLGSFLAAEAGGITSVPDLMSDACPTGCSAFCSAFFPAAECVPARGSRGTAGLFPVPGIQGMA
jgi:hypothetical protein